MSWLVFAAPAEAGLTQVSIVDWQGSLGPVWLTDTFILTYLPAFRFSTVKPLRDVTLVVGKDDFARQMRMLAERSVYPKDARERLEGFLGSVDLARELQGFLLGVDLSIRRLRGPAPDREREETGSFKDFGGRTLKTTRHLEWRTEACHGAGTDRCRRLTWWETVDPVAASQAVAEFRIKDEGKNERDHTYERTQGFEVVRKGDVGPVVRIRRFRHSKETSVSGDAKKTFLDHQDLDIRLSDIP